ncbi:MAG: hypothetical protein AB7O38_17775, partial [Pirellulaceae bacterium]
RYLMPSSSITPSAYAHSTELGIPTGRVTPTHPIQLLFEMSLAARPPVSEIVADAVGAHTLGRVGLIGGGAQHFRHRPGDGGVHAGI